MDDIQYQFVKNILYDARTSLKGRGTAFAPSNIALCKYWGKRDAGLNLPVNSSLSVSLGQLGTRTEIRPAEQDRVRLNEEEMNTDSPFTARTLAFLDLFRPMLDDMHFEVDTQNSIPTAAGLASSASGFAALVMALDNLAGWGLEPKKLSMLARIGSGSAARSVFEGFVLWNAGRRADGMDSYAEQLPVGWPELRVGIVEVSDAPKAVGSRAGMNRTVETSRLYKCWPEQAAADLETIRSAISGMNFPKLGAAAEQNALAMHATMLAAWPPLLYFQSQTIDLINKVHEVRSQGLEVYLTIDAGPNVKLLFLAGAETDVTAAFPGLQVVAPFC